MTTLHTPSGYEVSWSNADSEHSEWPTTEANAWAIASVLIADGHYSSVTIRQVGQACPFYIWEQGG